MEMLLQRDECCRASGAGHKLAAWFSIEARSNRAWAGLALKSLMEVLSQTGANSRVLVTDGADRVSRQQTGTVLSVEFLNWASNQATTNSTDGGFFSDLWSGVAVFEIWPESHPYKLPVVS